MATQIGILKLPEAFQIVNDDYFIAQISNVTYKIYFKDLLFNLDNASFSPIISAHSTQIITLSTNLYALSAETLDEFSYLKYLLDGTLNNAFNQLTRNIYPVGSIKQTTNPVNPGNYISNTTWEIVSGGNFFAGVGITTSNGGSYSTGDKNGDIYEFIPGPDTTIGEYSHKVVNGELPAHTHTFSIRLNQSGNQDRVNSYQNGPQNYPAMRLDNSTQYTTLSNVTFGDYHNNIPPVYGLYTWKRTA